MVVIAIIAGVLAGIIANLIADYFPARRHHFEAKKNPFVSPAAVPVLPRFLPRRSDASVWPPYLWSGLVAALLRSPVFDNSHRLRHILTEVGLGGLFGWLALTYSGNPSLPFFMLYTVIFALVIIIDVEHRWIMWEIMLPAYAIALLEVFLVGRQSLDDALRGGLYGFGSLLGLYLLGLVFASAVGLLTGRRIGRTVLGTGDIRLALFSGLIIGWRGIGPALLIMIVTGALAALILIVNKMLRKGRYRVFSAIPYGPYIVIGTAVMLYFPSVGGDLICLLLLRCV